MGLVLFGKKIYILFGFFIEVFGKRGRERGKKEKAGWFSEVVVAREKMEGGFL